MLTLCTVTKREKTMKEIIKSNLNYLIFLAIFGLIGGYFTIIYSLQSLSQDIIDEALAQAGNINIIIAVGTIQNFLYAVVCGIIGKILANKIGLWRKVSFEKKGTVELVLVAIIGGIALILPDAYIFANFSEAIKISYEAKPTVEYFIASITYGAVVEEIMLRLFTMSLIAILLQKLTKKSSISPQILIIANVISAILFAIGHLPGTYLMLSPVTPIIIFRCFLYNGVLGLFFGRLYRKYGIHYAMLAHGGVHIVSKLIWLLFI